MSNKSLLPDVVFRRGVFAVGTPGGGKSMGIATGIAIPVLERRHQLVVIDPTDAWFGLTLSASGKRASGYDITVFGGDHGSISLTPNMGRAMGELLGREPISAVLSMWHFSLEEQIEFVGDFSAAIMEVNRKPIQLIIDEADEFIPQERGMGKELNNCRLKTKRIVTRGRKAGFRPVLITQRPQALDTSVRNLCQVMIAFQCAGHHEQEQVKDYVKHHGDPKAMAAMIESLGELDVGEAWVWKPRKPKYLQRMQFPKAHVYDSWKEVDEDTSKIKSAPISESALKRIKGALDAFEEQRKANDPAALRAEIAALKRQIAKAPPPPAVNVDREAAAHAAGYAKADAEATRYVQRLRRDFEKILNDLKMTVTRINGSVSNAQVTVTDLLEKWPTAPVIPSLAGPGESYVIKGKEVLGYKGAKKLAEQRGVDIASISKSVALNVGDRFTVGKDKTPRTIQSVVTSDDAADIGGGALRMLQALAARAPARYTAGQWALLVKIKKGGSTWRTYLSRLRTAGLISENASGFTVSDAGAALAGQSPAEAVTPAEMLENWCKSVAGAGAMLRELAAIYPRSLSPATLCERLDMVENGSTYRTYKSRLKANGLIEITGEKELAASSFLMTGESS